jgi:hypothetical protein
MSIKSWVASIWASKTLANITFQSKNAVADQQQTMLNIAQKACKTEFGLGHNFNQIQTYSDFKNNIPLRNYEDIEPYIKKIIEGNSNVLWPGFPVYFAKSSGTTSGVMFRLPKTVFLIISTLLELPYCSI